MIYDVKIEGTFVIVKKVEAASPQKALKEAMRVAEVEIPEDNGFYVDGVSIQSEE